MPPEYFLNTMSKKLLDDLRPEGWDSNVIPLLIEGFPQQAVNGAAGIYNDVKQFQTTQNRGVIVAIDYLAGNLSQFAVGVEEVTWCDATISLKAGGQDLLVKEVAERYDYTIDLGQDNEVAIKTRLAGGQVLESRLEMDPLTTSTLDLLAIWMLLYYSTEDLEEWKKKMYFKAGTGVKRQSFKLSIDPGIVGAPQTLSDVLPKNQGPIIGFSITVLSAELFNYNFNLSVNGYQVVKNVTGLRFTRLSQRDPYIFFYPFDAGSKFDLSVELLALIGNDGVAFITFYFDN